MMPRSAAPGSQRPLQPTRCSALQTPPTSRRCMGDIAAGDAQQLLFDSGCKFHIKTNLPLLVELKPTRMIFFSCLSAPFLAEHPEVLRPGGKPQPHSGKTAIPGQPQCSTAHQHPARQSNFRVAAYSAPSWVSQTVSSKAFIPALQVLRAALRVLPVFQYLEVLPEMDRQPKSLCLVYFETLILQSILQSKYSEIS